MNIFFSFLSLVSRRGDLLFTWEIVIYVIINIICFVLSIDYGKLSPRLQGWKKGKDYLGILESTYFQVL